MVNKISLILVVAMVLSIANVALAADNYDALIFPNPYAIWTNLTNTQLQPLGLTNLQEFADPTLIYYEGVYYVYGTNTRGFAVARSTDNLQSFEHMGLCITSPPGAPVEHRTFWDPTIFYYDDTFYMYYESSYVGMDAAFDQRMKVAKADNPLGPFEYIGDLELDWDDDINTVWTGIYKWAISPHMVERDGKLYMFFAAKGWGEQVVNKNLSPGSQDDYFGTTIFMQQFSDPLTPIPGTRRQVLSPTIREELYDETGDFSNWEYCLEGPFYFEQDGTGFLMYSANAWTSPNYFIGYATWDLEGDLADEVFHKYPDDDTYLPLLGIDENATGMGHNSICVTPEGKILIAYHGRPVDTTGLPSPNNRNIRRLYISEMTVEDGRLVVHRRYDHTVGFRASDGSNNIGYRQTIKYGESIDWDEVESNYTFYDGYTWNDVEAWMDEATGKPIVDLEMPITDNIVLVPKLFPLNTALVSITGTASVASGSAAEATYTISAMRMPPVSGIELEFEVDGRYLSSKNFEAMNGFDFIIEGNYGTPIYWKNNGDIWTGKVTLLDKSAGGIGSNSPGFGGGDVDLLRMIFNVKEGALGPADVKLNYILMSLDGEWVAADIVDGVATTIFEQWYSPYDLTKDGVIDLNDLTFALQYLGVTSADPAWAEAYVCDLDPNGVIEVADLILILANYTISYYS